MEDLREVVARSLEAKGVLGKIKAEIRAAVFTTIDDQERAQGVHLENPRLAQLRTSPQGLVMLAVVEDFLGYYGMSFARSTLEAESGLRDEDFLSRSDAADALGIEGGGGDGSKPLLLHLLEGLANLGDAPSPTRGSGSGSPSRMGRTFRGDGGLPSGSPGGASGASDSFDEEDERSGGGEAVVASARVGAEEAASPPSPPTRPSRTAEIGLVMDTAKLRAEMGEEGGGEEGGGGGGGGEEGGDGGRRDIDELDAEFERELSSTLLGSKLPPLPGQSPSSGSASSPKRGDTGSSPKRSPGAKAESPSSNDDATDDYEEEEFEVEDEEVPESDLRSPTRDSGAGGGGGDDLPLLGESIDETLDASATDAHYVITENL